MKIFVPPKGYLIICIVVHVENLKEGYRSKQKNKSSNMTENKLYTVDCKQGIHCHNY